MTTVLATAAQAPAGPEVHEAADRIISLRACNHRLLERLANW